MPDTRYHLRALPQQRRLVPNLLRTILKLLEDARRPMRDSEIISALSVRFRRTDPDFQRQVRMNLRDAVSYGILKRQADMFMLRSKRLNEIMASLVPNKR
ncbi:uncharacterized protein LOC115629522 [Scaptodrosophila lebanonensis]|uniref:Uncharacterized protein LOC115629522 n=1 Tax=Drosophila lebanonensis TaxID=7225 RepID=A0A6J2U1U3_DROLE|nr:uncharacterized protein LOC115629522 [Scaptodrosophila lebanonensis]